MTVEKREILQADCEALNAAFDELGFEWQWDPDLYASLATIEDAVAAIGRGEVVVVVDDEDREAHPMAAAA